MTADESTKRVVTRPRMLFKPDPLLGWKLFPGGKVHVGFRDNVIQNVDEDGWRNTPDPTQKADARIVVYGCSFTYGTGLADHETYPSQLQSQLEGTAVLNRGIGGHSTVQNYIQFRTDLRNSKPDAALFGVLSDHRYRNILHPHRMRQLQSLDWYRLGVEHVPVAHIDRNGVFSVKYKSIWQPALNRNNFADFLPNDHILDLTTFCVFKAILKMAQQHQVKVVFALLDQLDPMFNTLFLSRFNCGVDVSVPTDIEHSFLPDDVHPNAKANSLFADRLSVPVRAILQELKGDPLGQ